MTLSEETMFPSKKYHSPPKHKTVDGLQRFRMLLWLSFSRDVLAVTEAYRTFSGVFTGKIGAFKT
jgi:hypothetical protein